MPTFSAFCDQGHEVAKIEHAPDFTPKSCLNCGSTRIEWFDENEIDKYLGKVIVYQTIISQNLSTKMQYSTAIPMYDILELFEQRVRCKQTKIKNKQKRR